MNHPPAGSCLPLKAPLSQCLGSGRGSNVPFEIMNTFPGQPFWLWSLPLLSCISSWAFPGGSGFAMGTLLDLDSYHDKRKHKILLCLLKPSFVQAFNSMQPKFTYCERLPLSHWTLWPIHISSAFSTICCRLFTVNTCGSLPEDVSVFLPDAGTYSTCIQDEQNRLESQYFWM